MDTNREREHDTAGFSKAQTEASLRIALAEYDRMINEIGSNIEDSRWWVRLAIALSATNITASLVAIDRLPAASAVLPGTMSALLVFFVGQYMRGDIKRTRVIGYLRDELEPRLRELAGNDVSLLRWHYYSAEEVKKLKAKSTFSFHYLGRSLTALCGFAAAMAFYGAGFSTLFIEGYKPEHDLLLFSALSCYALIALAIVGALHFFVTTREQEPFAGG